METLGHILSEGSPTENLVQSLVKTVQEDNPLLQTDIPLVVINSGRSIHTLEQFMDRPGRLRATVKLDTMESFIRYLIDFGSVDCSRVFFQEDSKTFHAILDYHDEDGPSWCEHTATFCPRASEEWLRWTANASSTMEHLTMARFLEENLSDIVEPAAGDLLNIFAALDAQKNANFHSAKRLLNGNTEFTFEELIQGTPRMGTLDLFDRFRLAIPVFRNGLLSGVEARLRYRVKDHRLLLWYELVGTQKLLEDAFREIRERISSETLFALYCGTPPA